MRIAYLDEFGHIGPFVSRNDKKHNTSPVFGLAGVLLPHDQARHLATFMLQLKEGMLAKDLAVAGVPAHSWEKKGSELISSKNIRKYAHIREGIRRLLNEIRISGGKIFFYGREKFQKPEDCRANGLYKTVLGHSIRGIDNFCVRQREQFMIIMDQHSGRSQWMETSAKTMFNKRAPARCMIEPPFEVESHLYQTIQIADWVATLIGRLMAYRTNPTQYADWEWAERYYGEQIDQLATDSVLWRPNRTQARLAGI